MQNAVKNLLLACKLPASSQLRASGPNMTLARDLLNKKKKEAVIDFIYSCTRFWPESGDGVNQVSQWRKTIEDGGIPDFKDNLDN